MAISQITNKSITDATITADDMAAGAVEGAMTTQIGGRRNLIINGALTISQRGSDINNVDNGGYTADRFKLTKSNLDELAIDYDQVADAPAGFSKSLKMTIATPETTLNANEQAVIRHIIEAQDLQHLNYGTSDAVACTLTFYVKGSMTGTYALSLYQEGGDKLFVANYTVSSANTWEQKTISIPANTIGAFNTGNGSGLSLLWWLSAGSDYLADNSALNTWTSYASNKYAYGHDVSFITNSGATWQITGVQLEVGSIATPFEHRSYGEELAACQRYFCKIKHDGSYRNSICVICNHNDITHYGVYHFPVTMRSAPTGIVLAGTYRAYPGGAGTNFSESAISVNIFSPESVRVALASSGGEVGDAHWLECYLSGSGLLFDAEL